MSESVNSPSTPPHVKLIINGEKRSSSNGETYKVYGYAGQLISTAESASWEDIEKAIETASAAQPAWEKRPVSERRDVLLRASELLIDPSKKYFNAFGESIRASLGDKVNWQFEVYGSSQTLQSVAAMSSRLSGETFPSRLPGGMVITQRRAYGVVLVMVPWNAPLLLAIRVIPLALLSGNGVVLRSSELVPYAHELVTELFHEAGLPKSLLNLINISAENNPILVPRMIAHEQIKLISFTGSSAVGKKIAEEAGRNLKEALLELGGKAPAIVLEDADIKEAARAIVTGAYDLGGQVCMSTTRVIVQRSVADALISNIKSLVQKLKVGQGEDANMIGVRNAIFAGRIIEYIKDAKNKGAEILVGDMKNDGSFIQPHLLLGYTPEMNAWKDEMFGPVLGITICDTVEEAIDLANDTEYSLTGCLWTTNLKALEWASRIHAGMVMINGSSFHVETGIGSTGLGGRSGFTSGGVEDFTQARAIVIFNDKVANPMLDNMGL